MCIRALPTGLALRMTEVTTRRISDECLDVRVASGLCVLCVVWCSNMGFAVYGYVAKRQFHCHCSCCRYQWQ